MKHKRSLAVSLLCISLVSSILVGLWALPRVSSINAYEAQIKSLEQDGTSLNLTIYGDPEGSRQAFDLFQYFTTKDLEWRGAMMDPQGNTVDIGLNLTSVTFEKLDADNYALAAEDVAFQLGIADMVNALVKADNVNIDITFWTYMDLPALNITAVLVDDVEVSLFLAVLPLPGLKQALYQYKGDLYIISICIIKPIEVTIVNPSEGDRVNGDVNIQALVKTAPGISVEHADWWTDKKEENGHFEGPMEFTGNSLWEGVWHSYHGGNGWYEVWVGAEGIQEGIEGGFAPRYGDGDLITVEVDNPPFEVHAYLETAPGMFDEIFGLMMEWWYHEEHETVGTPFDVPRRIGSGLMAPGELEWDGGPIHFERWIIRDGGEIMFEHWDPNLEVNQEILGMLWNRQLECIYKPA